MVSENVQQYIVLYISSRILNYRVTDFFMNQYSKHNVLK